MGSEIIVNLISIYALRDFIQRVNYFLKPSVYLAMDQEIIKNWRPLDGKDQKCVCLRKLNPIALFKPKPEDVEKEVSFHFSDVKP